MLRGGLWFLKSILLIAKNRHRLVVNLLFHSRWNSELTRSAVKPILWFPCELSKMVRVSCSDIACVLSEPKPGAHPPDEWPRKVLQRAFPFVDNGFEHIDFGGSIASTM